MTDDASSVPSSSPLGGVGLPLAEVLASLSYALDLTSGQPMGHAQRSCLIGMRIGKELGLPEADMSSLYHALLMKDTGCSSNAARMYEIFGSDDIAAKRASKVTDWSNLAAAARYAAAHTLPSGSLLTRVQRVLHIATHQSETSGAFMQARCDRGARIALSIGLGEAAADCIRHLDEHWDGRGAPRHVRGEAIPLLGRVACLAQTLEVFVATFGVDEAYAVARQRSGKWFDPDVVRAALAFRHDEPFWREAQKRPREALLALECRAAVEAATESRIDAVCDAFAQVVDAKSSFTAEHSTRVCAYSVQIAQALGIEGQRLTTLRRAALLHDVGKLAVSNAILDKPGRPTEMEWTSIRQHPYYTQQVLGRISGFGRLAEIAAAHHERLDGKGYFLGRNASQLDLDMRILAVADVFDALSVERPYRTALPLGEVFAILDRDAGVALDGDCIAALKELGLSERLQTTIGNEQFGQRAA